MREIKFRAWDKESKSMYNNISDISFADKSIIADFGMELIWDDDIILMQFTGIKDKEGKEIYEGDIIKPDLEVVYSTNYMNKFTGYFLKQNTNNKKLPYRLLPILGRDLEVIGNIYENKGLLKGDKQ